MSQRSFSATAFALSCSAFLIVGLTAGFLGANYLNRHSPEEGGAQTRPVPGDPEAVPQAVTQNGMMQDVARVIEKARANPEEFDAQMEAGSMYAQIQRADQALEFFDAAAKIKGLNFEQTVKLANAYFDVRQFDKARPLYQEALRQRPEDLDVRSDLGATHRDGSTPDFAAAIREFESVLKINPNHEPTLFNLGATYLKMGDRTNALKMLDRLEKAAPGNELATRLRQAINR